jgi:5'-AMP-activated protein kinase regulatory gamma subunit
MDWASGGADGGGVSNAPSSSAQVQTRAAGGLARSLAAGAQQQAVPQAGLSSEADSSRARVLEFLQRHTAYELLPESSKVVVLDTAISVRQAFHALFEQGVLTAPLWDAHARAFVGMISPGMFHRSRCSQAHIADAALR